MRLAAFAALTLCAPVLTAQAFSEEQRAELRQIIREEIQNAIQGMHGGAQSGDHPFVHKGDAGTWVTTHPHCFDVTREATKAAKGKAAKRKDAKSRTAKAMSLAFDGENVMRVDDITVGFDSLDIEVEPKQGDHVLQVHPEIKFFGAGAKDGEPIVLKLDGGKVIQLDGSKSLQLDGSGKPGKSFTIAIAGGKECCESECSASCSEAKEASKEECCEGGEKAECCEGSEKAECCEVVIVGNDKAEKAAAEAKKSKKANKKNKAKAKGISTGLSVFSSESELPATLEKAIQSTLREIH